MQPELSDFFSAMERELNKPTQPATDFNSNYNAVTFGLGDFQNEVSEDTEELTPEAQEALVKLACCVFRMWNFKPE